MPQKVKRATKHATRPNKPTSNDKCVNARPAVDSYGIGSHTRLKHHPLVLSQYKGGGPWVGGKRGYGLVVGRKGKPILGFPLKFFWGKCLTRMTYYPKEAKISWNYKVHAIGVSKRESQPLSGWECHG